LARLNKNKERKTIIQHGTVHVTFSRKMQPYAKLSFCHYDKLLTAHQGLKFAVDHENAMLNVP